MNSAAAMLILAASPTVIPDETISTEPEYAPAPWRKVVELIDRLWLEGHIEDVRTGDRRLADRANWVIEWAVALAKADGFDLEAFRERQARRAMAQAQAEQREYEARVNARLAAQFPDLFQAKVAS